MGDWDGGVIFEGSNGKIMCGAYARNPTLLPTAKMESFHPPKPVIPRVKESHQLNWVNGIKNGSPVSSPFDYAGPLTEMVLMGNLAIRSFNLKVLKKGKKRTDWAPFEYPGRIKLLWEGQNMRITNFEEANRFVKREYREG